MSNGFLNKKSFLNSSTMATTIGMLISAVWTNGKYKPEGWKSEYQRLSLFKKVRRDKDKMSNSFLTQFLSKLARVFLLFGVIQGVNMLFQYFIHTKKIYSTYFLYATLKELLIGIAIIKIYPFALSKLNIDVQGDFLKVMVNSPPSSEQLIASFPSKNVNV